MTRQNTPILTWDAAVERLGVAADASEEAIRAAYLAKVREFPPDKDPDAFERIRDAYDLLKRPRSRAAQVLVCDTPTGPLTDLLAGLRPVRRFAGHKLWMDALREKMKETRA